MPKPYRLNKQNQNPFSPWFTVSWGSLLSSTCVHLTENILWSFIHHHAFFCMVKTLARCVYRTQMFDKENTRTQGDAVTLTGASRVGETSSHTDPSIPTLSSLRARCQSSRPNRGGHHRGQFDFALKTETWASRWKVTHRSKWFHWIPWAQLL